MRLESRGGGRGRHGVRHGLRGRRGETWAEREEGRDMG